MTETNLRIVQYFLTELEIDISVEILTLCLIIWKIVLILGSDLKMNAK